MKHKIPPPVILLLSGIAAWFVAHSSYAYQLTVPYALVIAVVLAIIGLFIAGSAIRLFGKAQTTVNPLQPTEASALVDSGIFAWTRNPMYLGLLFVLAGWATWLESSTNILILLAFIVYITEFQIKPEEAALRELFGQDYIDYCERVRRWI